jgi:hypothetical protein
MMRWFDATNVRAAIIGGVAASLLGKPRLTKDIDAVVLDVDAQVLIESGAPYGFLPRIADAVDFARNTRMVLLRFTEGAIDIDLSLGALPFEYEVIERSSMIDVSPGVSIRVASPEDIIIMKAVAGRGRDITDRVRSTAAARMNPIPVPMRPNVAATCDGCRAPRVPLCRNEPERVSSHSH